MKEISKISCFENTDPCRSVACKSVNLKITSYIDEVTSVFGACNFANFTDYIVPTITMRVNPVLSDLNISETSSGKTSKFIADIFSTWSLLDT